MLLFVDMHSQGFRIAQIFFGLWLLPIGYMLFRSRYAPRAVATLVMVAAFGFLGDVVTSSLSPTLGESLAPMFIIPTTIGESSLVLWLLVKGLNFQPRVDHSGPVKPIPAPV